MSLLNEEKRNELWEEIETIPLQSDVGHRNLGYVNDSGLSDLEADDVAVFSQVQNVGEIEANGGKDMLEDSEGTTKGASTRESSRRPSDGASIDTKSVNSTSDLRTYREKLKERVANIKEKAGMSIASATRKGRASVPQGAKKPLGISRITDMLYQEEWDIEAALENRRKNKETQQRTKRETKKHLTETDQNAGSQDQSYKATVEFFTKTWEPSEPRQSAQEAAEERVLSSDEEEGAKVLAADYLGLKESLTEPIEFKLPIVMDTEEIREKLNYMLCQPDDKPVPETDRVGEGRKVRNLREEGLYVPEYPDISPANMNKFQRRLLAAGSKKWFGEDGYPIRLPNPLRKEPTPPPLDIENFGGEKLTRYEDAILFEQQGPEVPMLIVSCEEHYVLEFEILNVTFSHHPLFSKEHVVANKVLQLYKKYEARQRSGCTKRLVTRLDALRNARDNLQNTLEHEGDDTRTADTYLERLNRYKQEIKETREQRIVEGQTDKQLLVNLLSTWKKLKKVRQKQGYISTPIRLQIVKVGVADASEWNNEVAKQVEEILDELKEEKEKKKNTDAQKSEFIIDIDGIKQKIAEEVSKSVLTPEEPIITIQICEQRVTQDSELLDQMEIQRRSLVKRSTLWYRIYYNRHDVCKSSPQCLDSQFTCSFNQKIVIRIQEWPETLSVNIYSNMISNKGIFNSNPVATIFIPIPGKGMTLNANAVEEYEFSCQQVMDTGVRHCGVGSGVPFKLFADDDTTLCFHTTATLCCKTGWATHDGRVLCPPGEYFAYMHSKRYDPTRRTNTASLDKAKLKEWVKMAQLDPNDPNNASLFELLKKVDTNVQTDKDEFRIDSVQRMFDFCSEQELMLNPRLRLLMLRDKGEIEFKNMKAIPLREFEIPKDIFQVYEKRISSPELPFETYGLGQLEIHRAWGQHSLNMIYDRILKRCKLSQQHRTTQDIVQEEKVPSIGTLGLTFMKLFQPKRPLRPRRKGRKKIPVKGLTGQDVKIIVNVVRAFEIPVRKDNGYIQEETTDVSYIKVRPFVEITFRGQTKRTVTAEGPNPTWNQDLQFSLLSPNDGSFHIGSMKSLGDSLYLHLFDEVVIDILEDERKRLTTVHQRLERNWLGSLRIPFSTLYFNNQIEGTFQLYSPPFLLGYERQASSTGPDASHLRNSTFLTLFVIVQPPLCPPDPVMEHLECSESSYLEQHLENWSREVLKKVPNRPFKTFITDTTGKSVCVTRFFRPVSLPVMYENEELVPEMIARYVSLIPVSTVGALFFGNFNVWLTCDQVLRLLLGDREDHAVLLCCLFMKLGLKTWLLVGSGIPHGHSAYVLTKHDLSLTTSVYYIWDPVSGLKYSTMDSFSSLHKVYCLVNDENIWVNVQTEELVRRTNFDVSQQNDWWPAFDKSNVAPTASIQPAMLEYTNTSKTDVHLLQDKIEKQLRDAIMRWRSTCRTVWNRYCVAALRKLLPTLEKEACGIKVHSVVEHVSELQHISSSYKMCGFPISLPFTNIESILESVKSTGVHLNEHTGVEFAVAVYIHPYPNDVLAVWVYATSLIARR